MPTRTTAAYTLELAKHSRTYGSVYVADTTVRNGNFAEIHALTATVIASMTAAGMVGTLTAIALPAGDSLYDNNITAFTLTSGSVIAYNAGRFA